MSTANRPTAADSSALTEAVFSEMFTGNGGLSTVVYAGTVINDSYSYTTTASRTDCTASTCPPVRTSTTLAMPDLFRNHRSRLTSKSMVPMRMPCLSGSTCWDSRLTALPGRPASLAPSANWTPLAKNISPLTATILSVSRNGCRMVTCESTLLSDVSPRCTSDVTGFLTTLHNARRHRVINCASKSPTPGMTAWIYTEGIAGDKYGSPCGAYDSSDASVPTRTICDSWLLIKFDSNCLAGRNYGAG